jgi:hypothetical protein
MDMFNAVTASVITAGVLTARLDFVSALSYPKSKVMPPQFFVRSAIKTDRQQR